MPVIKDHPEWWVLDIMDGFVPHFMNPKALAIYWAHKSGRARRRATQAK
jgi:hypothetical protein